MLTNVPLSIYTKKSNEVKGIPRYMIAFEENYSYIMYLNELENPFSANPRFYCCMTPLGGE